VEVSRATASRATSRDAGRAARLPAIRLGSGTAEALKWLAFVLMVGDHVNKYLLHNSVPALCAAGRLVMPLFAFVLASHLAAPDALARGTYARVGRRLALASALSTVPFVALGGLAWGVYPLNVLCMLWLGTVTVWLLDRGGVGRFGLAAATLLGGGALVEFWWPGLAVFVSAWWLCRRPTAWSRLAWTASTACLGWVNGNAWALASLPLLLMASRVHLDLPRWRYGFYGLYPLHLGALWLIKLAMGAWSA